MNFHSIPDLQLCLPLIVIVEDISYCPICLRIWIFLNLDFSFSLIFKRFFWCGPFLKSLLNLLQYCFCFTFHFFGHEACGISAPRPGIEPTPPELEGEVFFFFWLCWVLGAACGIFIEACGIFRCCSRASLVVACGFFSSLVVVHRLQGAWAL